VIIYTVYTAIRIAYISIFVSSVVQISRIYLPIWIV